MKAIMLVALLTLSPLGAAAQTVTATTTNDGSSEAPVVRQERIRNYRQQSSALKVKIGELSDVAETNVAMPVLFGVTLKDISPNFGDPRSGGRSHEGEDILAVKGTPIVSPTAAVVLRTGVGATEGNYVYTANPGGETFVYMHLDRIGEGVAAGSVLSRGTLIGYVGDTGNALGGPAHLHFEIHNNSGTPVDPFPRLATELQFQEKMNDLTTILSQTANPVDLAHFLVLHFRSTFTASLAAGVTVPSLIADALSNTPDDSALTKSDIVALQNYLIRAATGVAATKLAGATATGNFGPITRLALIEYQLAKGLSPADGSYGSATRAYVAAHPLDQSTPPAVPTTPTNPNPASGTLVLTRNLTQGSQGEDVRSLQQFLNRQGYLVSQNGAGSPNNETIYFGPATASAVAKFQIGHSISPAAGYVGPITRAAISALSI